MTAQGDMVYTGVYDGSQIMAGLKAERAAVLRQTQETQARQERAIKERNQAEERGAQERERILKKAGKVAMAVGAGSTALAYKAIMEYAKESQNARAQIDALDGSVGRLLSSIGRDLTSTGMLKFFREVIDWAGRARNVVVDFYATMGSALNPSGGTIGQKNRAMAADADLQKQFNAQQTVRRELAGGEVERARARGDTVGAAALESRVWLEDRKRQIQEMKNLNDQEKRVLIDDAATLASARVEDARNAKRASDAKAVQGERERLKQVYATDRARFDALKGDTYSATGQANLDKGREALDVAAEELRIKQLLNAGQDEAAQKAEIELKYRQQIRDVQREVLEDSMAYNGEQQSVIDKLNKLKDLELSMVGKGRQALARTALPSLPYDRRMYRDLYLPGSGAVGGAMNAGGSGTPFSGNLQGRYGQKTSDSQSLKTTATQTTQINQKLDRLLGVVNGAGWQ